MKQGLNSARTGQPKPTDGESGRPEENRGSEDGNGQGKLQLVRWAGVGRRCCVGESSEVPPSLCTLLKREVDIIKLRKTRPGCHTAQSPDGGQGG